MNEQWRDIEVIELVGKLWKRLDVNPSLVCCLPRFCLKFY